MYKGDYVEKTFVKSEYTLYAKAKGDETCFSGSRSQLWEQILPVSASDVFSEANKCRIVGIIC